MASSSANDQRDLDADKMLQTYLYDYMIKRGLINTAEIFKNEAQVSNSFVVESPTGLLEEWWSIFYDVFTSRQGMSPEAQPASSSNVPNLPDMPRNDAPLSIPQMAMIEHIRHQQFQANSTFSNIMMAQSASCLRPSTFNINENLEYLTKSVEPTLLDFINATNPNFLPGTVMPLDGPHETNSNEVPNLMSLNGGPLNVGDLNQILTSPLQTPSYHQHYQMLKAKNQKNKDAVLSQALGSTSKTQIFTAHRNITKYRNQNRKIPRTESSNRDTKTRTGEPLWNHDQQIQMHSQNVEVLIPETESSNRDTNVRTGEPQCNQDKQIIQYQNVEDCVDAADGKPEDENVESFLSIEDEHVDHKIMPFNNLKHISQTICSKNKGFSFEEVICLHASRNKVLSSHFSSNGKVLASVGHEKKVFIWNMETYYDCVTSEETHSHIITDVRFKPASTIFATSSFDKSVRLWDAAKPARSFLNLVGHAEQVMSLDFHPKKVDILCSCDRNDTIRLWNIKQQTCMHITKGGSKQVRFQPHDGKFLATATGNNIKIIDVETTKLVCNLKGHVKEVVSICWDRSGEYVASVSEDSARIWSDGKCITELHSSGSMFQSCIFHPAYTNLLVIGGYESLELWSPSESNKTLTVPAHKGLIAGLAASPKDELIASASHDHFVKIWK